MEALCGLRINLRWLCSCIPTWRLLVEKSFASHLFLFITSLTSLKPNSIPFLMTPDWSVSFDMRHETFVPVDSCGRDAIRDTHAHARRFIYCSLYYSLRKKREEDWVKKESPPSQSKYQSRFSLDSSSWQNCLLMNRFLLLLLFIPLPGIVHNIIRGSSWLVCCLWMRQVA